jgi:hypothetical protein
VSKAQKGRNTERKIVRAAAAPGATWWLGLLGPDSDEGSVERVSKRRREMHREKDSEH